MLSLCPEVIEVILKNLTKEDISHCASASRQFCYEAQRQLFKSVDFEFSTIHGPIQGSKTRKLVRVLSQSARLRALVQTFGLSIGSRDLDHPRSVLSALPLPNLRTFVLINSFPSAVGTADVAPWDNVIYTLLDHTSLQSVFFTGNAYSWYSIIQIDLAPFTSSVGSTAVIEPIPSTPSFCTLVAEACAYHYTGRIQNLSIHAGEPLFWDIYTVNRLLGAGALNVFKIITRATSRYFGTLSLSSFFQAQEIIIDFVGDPHCNIGSIVATLPSLRALKVFKVNLSSPRGLRNLAWDRMDLELSRDPSFQTLELGMSFLDVEERESFEKIVFPTLRSAGQIKWKWS